VLVLRVVYIQRSAETGTDAPRYDVIDAGRYGEEAGFAETANSMTQSDVAEWFAREGLPFAAVGRVLAELSEKGTAQLQLPPRIGPRIVRAWFDTVLNPLIEYVESEIVLLERKNWTYSFGARTLELIRPIRQSFHNANFEQILQMNAPLSANIETHDAAVERLSAAVASLHEALVSSRDFVQLCDSLLAPENLSRLGVRELSDVFGAYPPSGRYHLIAQYVVNGTGELPPHYSTARFWNENREHLLKSLTSLPNVREHFASTAPLGPHLTSVSRTLASQVKKLRQELSLQYDVPIILGNHKRTA